jgi:hypothetical protein
VNVPTGPLVSGIGPADNAGAAIAEILESARGQPCTHRAVIGVDNGSADQIERRVESGERW